MLVVVSGTESDLVQWGRAAKVVALNIVDADLPEYFKGLKLDFQA